MLTRILTLVGCILAFANLAAQQPKNTSKANSNIQVKRFDNTMNSPIADFAPVRYGDRVYFSSLRQETVGGTAISRIFSYTPGHEPTVDAEFNPKNNESHIACPTLMPDASRMYFTLCRDEAMQKCEIWYRDREYEGTWGVAQRLPEFINARGANTAQPAIGWDATLKKYTLFFASNRAGGKGKMDIWASTITWDGKFEAPVCLPFNTPEDEVTPSFSQTGQTLFFSSNGLKGQGRFDIFAAQKNKDGNWASPQNLGRPFNSAYDDMFYTYHESSQTGYLASDRPGSLCTGSVEGFGCFDIYEVKKTVPATPLNVSYSTGEATQ
ncbi:MAG: hypothetical protein K9J37_17405 [Saprospiraceae bacterium]|nr:hypothetical protein [Saprospiraceae bacterium]MCF8251694.1 hypothetical protein [Saprospiraceae bacterium]MCF8282039.1 hypothetical protein [Bacteroidales bacterium]MCF8311241.1 hypothetical protein [Saprospiraceae bacterium]MCF8442057.1 hypothetical protein [Saprospiraceae bacterium]